MGIREITRELLVGDEKALVASDYSGPMPDVFGAGSAKRRLSHPSAKRHLQAYAGGDDAVDWVMDCAWLIAETISQAPYHFEQDDAKFVVGTTKGAPKGTKRAPLDLINLLSYPNPYMTWEELIELTAIDYLLVGNSYWLKYRPDRESGKPLGLWRLAPDLVDIEVNEKGRLSHYRYSVSGSKPVEYAPEAVLHMRRPNPHDPYFGAGIIAGAPRMYDLELYLTESQAGYYERGTRLSGVLETDKNVPPALFNKIKATVRDLYSGRDNAHQLMVLERGLKYNAIQSNATEAGYIDAAKFSRDRICQAFRVPPPLLGDVEGADRQAIREAQRTFDTKTMRPLLNKLQTAISTGLTQAWGLDFCFEYDYLPPKEDQMELAGNIAALPGVTIREVRAAAGYEPLGKPEIDDLVLNLPGEDDNESDVKDRNLTGEAGRPPKGENTRAIKTGKKPADAEVRSG